MNAKQMEQMLLTDLHRFSQILLHKILWSSVKSVRSLAYKINDQFSKYFFIVNTSHVA
jgi:hypothetical protein